METKLTINTKELKETLKILNRTADKFTDMSISIGKNCMFLGACDIHAKLSVISDMEENINFFIRIKELKKIVDDVKAENISFEIEENILLLNGIYRFSIDKEYKSKIDFFGNEKSTSITLSFESFIKALNKSVFYSKDSYKPALTGVNFNFTDNRLEIASTEGRCLNRETLDVVEGCLELNTTYKIDNINAFLMLTKKEKDTNGNIDIKIVYVPDSDNALILSYKNFTFKFNGIDGKYPDVNRIIPNKEETKDNYKTFNFDKSEAIEAIKIIATVANKGEREKRTYLRIEKNGISFIHLGNIYLDEKTAGVYIKAEHNDSEGTIYAFNCEYLLEVFKCLDNERIEFNITKGSNPAYIFENKSEYLIMPINSHDKNGNLKSFDEEDIVLKYKVNII